MSAVTMLANLLKAVPKVTSISGLSTLFVNASGEFVKMDPLIALASLLMPNATVLTHNGGTGYTRSQWIQYSTAPTYWPKENAKAGDVLVVTATTSDTKQRVVHFFLAKSQRTSTSWSGDCFLLLLEGEAPLWPNLS